MTPAAKPPLSLQQVPPAPLESENPGSFSISSAVMKTERERRERKTYREDREVESQPSLANKFLSHFPQLKHGSIFPPTP